MKGKKKVVVFNPFDRYSQIITIIIHRWLLGVGCNPKISSFAQVNYDKTPGRSNRNKTAGWYCYPGKSHRIKTK
jgi:hypothetical protein